VALNGGMVDLGLVEERQRVEIAFTLENRGQKLVRIVNVKTGCGCTEAVARTTEIAPGEQTIIDLAYTGRDGREREILKVWVFTDNEQQPVMELTALATIKPIVFWYPASLSFFVTDEQIDLTSRVWFRSGFGNVQLTSIETSDPSVTAVEVEEDGKIVCLVSVARPASPGNRTESVSITTVAADKTKTIRIPIYIMRPPNGDVDN